MRGPFDLYDDIDWGPVEAPIRRWRWIIAVACLVILALVIWSFFGSFQIALEIWL